MLSFSLTGGRPVDFFFVDDAYRLKPSRPGMYPLAAIGGVRVESEQLSPLNKALEELCRTTYRFPVGEEFKWSPQKTSWMARRLTDTRRRKFYLAVIETLRRHDVVATVMIATRYPTDRDSMSSATTEATKFYLERVEQQCRRRDRQGFIIVDRPGGGPKEEAALLKRCAAVVEGGTYWVKFAHIAHGLLAADSRTSRLLQAADLVVSCTAAAVAGEQKYALPVFLHIEEMLDRAGDRVQGYGLKIDPDDRHANLYYWLLAAEHFWHGRSRWRLPRVDRNWATDSMEE